MKREVPTSKNSILGTFLKLADVSFDQCFSCIHFLGTRCELNLPLALCRDSDVCGWWGE